MVFTRLIQVVWHGILSKQLAHEQYSDCEIMQLQVFGTLPFVIYISIYRARECICPNDYDILCSGFVEKRVKPINANEESFRDILPQSICRTTCSLLRIACVRK